MHASLSRRRCAAARLLVLGGALSFLSIAAAPQEDSGASVDETRATIEKWVETRRIISQEQRDWAIARELLNERIDLVQGEIDKTSANIAEAEATRTDKDKESAELTAKFDALKLSAEELKTIVTELEARTKMLLAQLPEPILERVRPISQKFPADTSDTKASLSDRFLYVIGVLNEVDKFNREITLASEVRTLPDGTSAEVTTLYIGLSQAYYLGANGKAAGVGRPSESGWVWTSDKSAAPQIAEAIAILKSEKVASFVKLPVEIK